MDQTMVTLLIATGVAGAAIAGGYLAARAATHDADAAISRRRASAAPRPAGALESPAAAVRRPRAAAPAVQGTTMTLERRELQMVELDRTRTILLGLLNVLEALAFGEASRATAARAVLGDVSDCNISLVGDASVVSTYLLTAEMLRTQVGQGLPSDGAAQVASIRVKLLDALALQEGRLSRGEEPLIMEPAGNPDFFSDELMTPRRRATPSRRRA
jgi:hypothetical protein